MKAPVFPIFTLKVKNGLVIAGGGGGDKRFGKMNGVVVLDNTTTKDIGYYETSDIIVDICVYDPAEDVEEIEEDDMSWDEYDEDTSAEPLPEKEDSDSCSKSSGGSKEEKDFDGKKSSDDSKDNSGSEEHSKDGESLGSSDRDGKEKLYLACSGEKFFYILKFENPKFTLIKKIEKKISSQIFAKDLYVISGGALFGFYNAIKTPEALDDLLKPEKRRKKINSSLLDDESHEEYTYRLFKKNKRIVFKREEGRSDILNNWEKFFITAGIVHKVVVEEGKFTFVHNSKKYSYDKEVGKIIYKDGMLVYYLKGKDSVVYFQSENERIYNISKVTAMAWDSEQITIGTGDGYVYLFNDCTLKKKKKVCDAPITGVGFMEGHVYFSSLNGLIDRRDILQGCSLLYIVIAAIILIAAVLVGVFSKK